jgi:hypothetical protein
MAIIAFPSVSGTWCFGGRARVGSFWASVAVFFGALLVVAVCLWTNLSRDRVAAALEGHDPNADA